MAEIILIHPRCDFWDERLHPIMPLNLLHVCTLAASEFDIKIIDQRIFKDNWQEKMKENITKDTLLIGFTLYTSPMILHALKVTHFIKENYPQLPVVFGGVHPSLDPETTLKHGLVDIIALGEGEETLLNLARALKQKLSFSHIKGIGYKEQGQLLLNPLPELLNINALPDVPYHLIDLKKYLYYYKGCHTLGFLSSRGCVCSCNYCYNQTFNQRKWRALTPENTLERIQNLKNICAHDQIYFGDDNFFLDLDRGEKIVKGLKIMDLFSIFQGVDIPSLKRMDHHYLSMLERNGCRLIIIGIETASPNLRKRLNKPGTLSDIINVVKKLKTVNMEIICNFMYNLPGETETDLKQQAKFIVKLVRLNNKLTMNPLYHYTPFPKTELFEIAKNDYGFIPAQTLDEWGEISDWHVSISAIDPKRQKLLENLHFCSIFVDNTYLSNATPFIFKFLLKIYHPIIRFRMNYLFFHFFIERKIAKIMGAIFYRMKKKRELNLLKKSRTKLF